MQLYNVKKFIDADLRFPEWTDAMINGFIQKCRKISALIGRFLSKVDNSNILWYYNEMNGVYEDNFWEAVCCEYKLFEMISSEKLNELLYCHPGALGYILRYKKMLPITEMS